ncbi:MAG: hypothetical protein LBC97_12085 [Bifidobacteriaceae bacterium]|jgi:hypothetical protein|nr:hypothetical protein [Bifidobacteriaceae bacterium]
MKAYDILFERADGTAAYDPEYGDTFPAPDRPADGWIGTEGPGMDPETWPRGPETGLPMFHAITLRLPADYQRKGAAFTGIAFFQGEGEFAEPYKARGFRDPFVKQLKDARPHPQLQLREDLIGGQFALIWLTEEELSRGPASPPPDPRRPGEHLGSDDGGPNAWDEGPHAVQRVWLAERPDPNAGLAPLDHSGPDDAYRPRFDSATWELEPWARPLAGRCHLGGTAFPIQALPDGLTPWYLELTELPGLNFGTGNAQIDLESDAFDWACG